MTSVIDELNFFKNEVAALKEAKQKSVNNFQVVKKTMSIPITTRTMYGGSIYRLKATATHSDPTLFFFAVANFDTQNIYIMADTLCNAENECVWQFSFFRHDGTQSSFNTIVEVQGTYDFNLSLEVL